MAVFVALVVGFAAGSVVGWRCGRGHTAADQYNAARDQQRRGDYWFSEYRKAVERDEVSQ